jgi:hypothetical protein
MSLENTIVNESTQPKKIVYCMNPFIWNVLNRQVYTKREQTSGFLGNRKILEDNAQGFFGREWKCSRTNYTELGLHNSVNILQTTELYTLNG